MHTRHLARYMLLGAPVDALDMPTALRCVDEWIADGIGAAYILAVNPEKVYALRASRFLRGLFRSAILLIPDGTGVVLALRILLGRHVPRVTGADLMQQICAVAPERGYRIFIYGASEAVNRAAVATLRQRHPGIAIVGRAHGYTKPGGMDQVIRDINRSEADVLFVALGSPRQEQWIAKHLPVLKVKICQGIGGTLDTIAGDVKRAPALFRVLGLEWFYRLLCQPTRLRRQLSLGRFAWEVLLAKARGSRGAAYAAMEPADDRYTGGSATVLDFKRPAAMRAWQAR